LVSPGWDQPISQDFFIEFVRIITEISREVDETSKIKEPTCTRSCT